MTNQEKLEQYVLELIRSEKLSMVTINNGELIEAFDQLLHKAIMPNIADINTTLEKRSITIKVEFNPSADRSYIQHKIAVTHKLAGMAPMDGACDLRIDAHGGGFFAKKRKEQEQQGLFDNVQSITEGRQNK